MLRGSGLALPEFAIAQEHASVLARDLSSRAHDKRGLVALYRRSGVRRRYSVLLETPSGGVCHQTFYQPASDGSDRGPTTACRMRRYDREALPLALAACRRALQSASIDATKISHLVTASCTGFAAPGVDLGLIEQLGLRNETVRTHIGFMGCHAMMNALRVAAAFATSAAESHVLVCAVELCSLHQQYHPDAQQAVANALFSDGAAATVVSSVENREGDWELVSQRSWVLSGTAELMQWSIGDHGFQMSVSPQVPATIREQLGETLEPWLAEHGWSAAEIGSWAIHPGGPRILGACAEGAGFAAELLQPSRDVLAQFGNMSSPTVLFVLDQLAKQSARRPCVMLAFGPGLTIEAALLE
jgi:predicted naringenin-chalcone synthase